MPKKPSPFQGVGQGPSNIPSQVHMPASKGGENELTGLGDFFENFTKTYLERKKEERAAGREVAKESRATEREAVKERAAQSSLWDMIGGMDPEILNEYSATSPQADFSAAGSPELRDLMNYLQGEQTAKRAVGTEQAKDVRETRQQRETERLANLEWDRRQKLTGTRPTYADLRKQEEMEMSAQIQRQLSEQDPEHFKAKESRKYTYNPEAVEKAALAFEREGENLPRGERWHYAEGGIKKGKRPPPPMPPNESMSDLSPEAPAEGYISWLLRGGPLASKQGGDPMALPGAPPAPGVAPQSPQGWKIERRQ